MDTLLTIVRVAVCLFLVGRYLGRRFFIRKDFFMFKKEDIIRAENWLRKYGYFLILINRFLPGIRSVISITGGISGLRATRVIIFSLISCALWNFIWISIGYTLGNNWETAEKMISAIFARYNMTIFILFAGFILFLVIKKIIKR